VATAIRRIPLSDRTDQTTGDGYESACTRRRSSKHRNQYAAFGVLTWPMGTLQESGSVTGPYTNVVGATSPYTNALSGPQGYFRLKVQ